jgi:hypothetical protein
MKNIHFKACEVEYNEAIDGEIVQITFDEDPEQDPFNRTKCYVMISQNYEFPGTPNVEWHDGESDDGGSEVLSYRLNSDLFELTTTDGVAFRVQHDCRGKTFIKIQEFLQREFGNSKQN